MKKPTLFVDVDVLRYRICFGCAAMSFAEACEYMDKTLYEITEKFDMPSVIAISNRNPTFRHKIAVTAPYKGTRKADKPPHFYEMGEYLKNTWKAVESPDGLEADDFIGISANRNSVIATIDKDLKMIPAWYYHIPANKEWTLKKIKRPLYYFWHQVLTGDTADNIIGLAGIGETKATEILSGLKLKEMKNVVYSKYVEHFGENAQARFHENCQLLWILRHPKKSYLDYI